jgi:transcriptional regulator with XRE-family HTH domain
MTMTDDLDKISAFIMKARKKSNLTQSELAMKCKISFRTMQRIEHGIVSPRLDVFMKIIDNTNAGADDLLVLLKYH